MLKAILIGSQGTCLFSDVGGPGVATIDWGDIFENTPTGTFLVSPWATKKDDRGALGGRKGPLIGPVGALPKWFWNPRHPQERQRISKLAP